ncbi:MAG: ABC transporter permease, partial [Oscillospiraceae bacterium]
IFIIVFFQIVTDGKLLAVRNLRTIFNQVFTVLLGACGVAFVISQGNLDFSIGSIAGTAAAVGCMVSGGGPLISLVVALLVGCSIGALNGAMHVVFKAPANIVTLCTQFTFRGVIAVLTINGMFIPLAWSWIDSIPMKIAVIAVAVVVSLVAFEYTKLGKYCKAIGAGGIASVQSGVPLGKMKVISFMISGAVAGICGFFMMVRAGSVAPTTGISFEMDVLLAIVLGGMPLSGGSGSKIRAAVIGSVMLGFLMNGLVVWGIGDTLQQGVKGIIFLVAVAMSFERENLAVIK